MQNMVDERFELAAVIFRLAGALPYTDLKSDYQREVAEAFAPFAGHKAVNYAKKLKVGYDQVFRFAIHIEKRKKDKFALIEDLSSLGHGWNPRRARKFLRLFNKFYRDTDYAVFFNAHRALFEQATQKYIDEVYSKIDMEWFAKYAGPANFRCILSLSSGNYGATLNDKIVYSLVCAYADADVVIHEYCHHFANPLADTFYEKNEEFKQWCDDSVDRETMPFYGNGWVMGREYVTRACTILYGIQHGRDMSEQFSEEKSIGFKYIEQVYEMILEEQPWQDKN